MRLVDVKYGLLEKINDLFGNLDTTGDITNWSVQGVLLENIKRITQSFAGTIGWGLTLTPYSNGVTISQGVAFSPSGDIIYWHGGNNILYVDNGDSIYIKPTSIEDTTNGHQSNLVAASSISLDKSIQIVHDSDTDISSVFTTDNSGCDECVYIGRIDSNGAIVNDAKRGFTHDIFTYEGNSLYYNSFNTDLTEVRAKLTVKDIVVSGTSSFTGDASFVNLSFSGTLLGSGANDKISVSNIVVGDITSNSSITTPKIIASTSVKSNSYIASNGVAGVTGSFKDKDDKVISVTNGIITKIL